MSFFKNLRYSILKRFTSYKKSRIWAKYGDETRYHFIEDKQIRIGEHTYGIPTIYRYDGNPNLIIGKYCSIAKGVEILIGGNHHIEWCSTFPFYKNTKIFTNAKGFNDCVCEDTVIGNDVWIGKNVLILGGVKIGNGAVIGAGSVVSKDIPPYAIAVGNPIKVIKYRFPSEIINSLEEIKWWEQDSATINKELPNMMNADFSEWLQNKLNKKNGTNTNKT